ncbi:MAG: transposase [Nitrosopumilus sp.]|nr:transposase [Nitrosopumilus sp.]MDH5658232.1 transposase [Nitrosopumilus sp.]
MQFQELSDQQWKTIRSHVPKPVKTGRPRADNKRTTNGIMFALVTGCRWREMPEKYGDDSAAHRRLQNWQERNAWKKILSGIMKSAHKANKTNLQKISVDSTSIPAKKEAA